LVWPLLEPLPTNASGRLRIKPMRKAPQICPGPVQVILQRASLLFLPMPPTAPGDVLYSVHLNPLGGLPSLYYQIPLRQSQARSSTLQQPNPYTMIQPPFPYSSQSSLRMKLFLRSFLILARRFKKYDAARGCNLSSFGRPNQTPYERSALRSRVPRFPVQQFDPPPLMLVKDCEDLTCKFVRYPPPQPIAASFW